MRFFLVTPSALVEIDLEGKRIESARDVSYTAGTLAEESGKRFSGTRPDDLSPGRGIGSLLITPLPVGKIPSPEKARLYLNCLTLSGDRGSNSGKHGNSTGTIRHSPAGTDEVIFSNVTAGRGRGARCSCKGGIRERDFRRSPCLDP